MSKLDRVAAPAEAVGAVTDAHTHIRRHAHGVRSRSAARAFARPWTLVVWAALASWSALLVVEARSDYLGFRFGKYDLGNMVQAVWSTAHGRALEQTLGDGEQASRLASHVDPILALFAPLWLVWPSPLLLAGAQIVACALGALPVFWLARRHLASERAAGLLALAYLAYPWLVWTALDAMHPVTLAIPLFLYAVWFLDSDRMWAFALCAVLILTTGELMGASIAALGVWYWLRRGNARVGLTIAAAGIAWTSLALKVIVPHFHGDESPFHRYYGTVGGSPEGAIRTLFTDPGAIASALFGVNDIAYLIFLGLPLAGLFLLSPGLAAVSIPQLVANGLSDSPASLGPQQHYVAAAIPFLIAATVLGIARVRAHRQVLAATVVLVGSAVMTFCIGPWPGALASAEIWYQKSVPARHVAALREAISLVPADAPVTTTNKAGSHLSERRYVYTVPVLGRAEWVVLDTQDPWVVGNPGQVAPWERPDRLRAFLQRMERDPAWTRVFARDGVLVFELRRR